MSRLEDGIEKLGVIFSEGMSLIASQLEIQNNNLTEVKEQLLKIHETLKSPAITQSTEWRNLGLDRLENGLWPEAIEAFLKAISLDGTDPISNLMLGKLYLDAVDKNSSFHEPEKAYQYFSKTIRYANALLNKAPHLENVRSESLYLCATALLAMAAIDRANGKSEEEQFKTIEQSLQTINQLLEVNPNHLQGKYFRTKILIILQREEDAFSEFKSLVEIEPLFLSTASSDGDFSKHSVIGKRIIERLEPWFRKSLGLQIITFYDLLEAVIFFELEIPSEMKQWLSKENIETRELGELKYSNTDYYELLNLETSIFSVLTFSNKQLSGLLAAFKHDSPKQVNDLINQILVVSKLS
ncbi:MAG: hypothetical protein KGZ58_09670 [Ignavibacteriales bacterium]|nr:hypothetical protein [Ignavibacteriales bacterium]